MYDRKRVENSARVYFLSENVTAAKGLGKYH